MHKNKNIAVIFGGPSSEVEVSKRTSEAVFNSLIKQDYKAKLIEFSENITIDLKQNNIELVYNAMHGKYGEDGCLQGLLEVLKISYTHSGVLASAIAMNKAITKELVKKHGVNTAEGKIVSKDEIINKNFKLPVVIKPISEGSSVGVHIIKTDEDFKNLKLGNNQEYLVEEYIEGIELSAAVLNGEGLGVIEISPKSGVYDYASKYTKGASEYICPARVNEKIYNTALDYAVTAHNILNCRGVSRSDIIYSPSRNRLYFLEINTHPGMTENSLVPKIANYKKINFDELVEKILNSARLDYNG